MTRTVMATTARMTTTAARAMETGATRRMAATTTIAMMVATMTPNGNKDNKDNNINTNIKAKMMETAKTEGGDHC
jgi:hypothetical protein